MFNYIFLVGGVQIGYRAKSEEECKIIESKFERKESFGIMVDDKYYFINSAQASFVKEKAEEPKEEPKEESASEELSDEACEKCEEEVQE